MNVKAQRWFRFYVTTTFPYWIASHLIVNIINYIQYPLTIASISLLFVRVHCNQPLMSGFWIAFLIVHYLWKIVSPVETTYDQWTIHYNVPLCSGNHSNITCREDYVLQNGVCNPRCGEFKVNSPIAIQITFGSEMIAGVIVVIISICIFALTFVNRKSM